MEKKYQIAFPNLGEEEKKNLLECINSGWISSKGKFIQKFEKSFAKFCGVKYSSAVSNGTLAINLALSVLGIKHGDEVIIPDLTFGATANAPMLMGVNPVLVDVERDSWNIDPVQIEKAVSSRTKAIIPVHLYGVPCRMDEILKIARKHNLYVIEDAAESHGAVFQGEKVGSFGDIGCFSFFGNKIITTGEGGMCTTNNRKYFEKMKVIKNHGMQPDKKYWHEVVGSNYRMTNMQAAIGCAQVKKIEDLIKKKRAIAQYYIEEIKSRRLELDIQQCPSEGESVWWMFTVLLNKDISPEVVMNKLTERGIDSRPIFAPLHEMPAFKKLKRIGNLKTSSDVGSRGITLPSNYLLDRRKVEYIIRSLGKIIDEERH